MNNIKNSFKYIGKEFKNFKLNEKCLLNGKFKIQKPFKKNIIGYIDFDKIKYKKIYTKINVIIKEVKDSLYKISISKNYPDFNLYKNDLYYVNYKLLYKCSNEAWEKNLKKKEKIYEDNDIIENNTYIDEKEEQYIIDNISEYEN